VQGAAPNTESAKLTTYNNEAWFHAEPLVQQELIDPKLSIKHDDVSSTFVVKAERGVAAWVWLDHPAGVSGNFDDNGFWLLPQEEKKVGFKVKKDSTCGDWVKSVTVRSLWDNTQ
jgi:beta-mannosidase